jgi:hypothetical protein
VHPIKTKEAGMKIVAVTVLLLGISATAAGALDMQELAPCKPAAARLCDHEMTWSNLLRCGQTLAAHSWRVSFGCRQVLRKYGQL